MRTVPFLVVIASLATACEWSPQQFQYRSTLYQATRGAALQATPDGQAQVGMMSTTCAIDPFYASAGSDYDYPGTEQVDDIGDDGVVVITGDDKVHLQHATDWWSAESDDVQVNGVITSRATPTGAVAIAAPGNDCNVTRIDGGATDVQPLKPDICADLTDFSAGPGVTVFVGTTTGGYAIDDEGTTQITDAGAELVVFDDVTGLLYTADNGGDTVTAVDEAGIEAWTSPVGGSITDIADMGTEASVAVTVALPDGTGAVLVLDGFTGLHTSTLVLPSPADNVYVSNDGSELAVSDDSRMAFYGVSSVW